MNQVPNFKEIIACSPVVFTIGVAGDSGSGKTTFTSAIREIFGLDLVSTITLDDYHRYTTGTNASDSTSLPFTPMRTISHGWNRTSRTQKREVGTKTGLQPYHRNIRYSGIIRGP